MSADLHRTERIWRNGVAQPASPSLSILTPVYDHDASPLIAGLARGRVRDRVEIILLDDGSPDAAVVQALKATASKLDLPISIVEGRSNVGRSRARNRLVDLACGGHVLLLDADMIPDADDFLDRWISLIHKAAPAIAFGGFSVSQAPHTRDTALHRFVSIRSDCRRAADRARDPAQFTTTSNLLIRRDVIAAIPFDESFAGWGWEDVEWALRAQAVHKILHIDNTATHAGLDDEDTLLRKARQGAANYRRLFDKHPAAVQAFRSFRAARRLKAVPGVMALRPMLERLVRARAAPLSARNAAYKLFRTLTYAQALP